MEALRLNGVTKVYGSGKSRVVALRNITLSMMEGELACLMGPSGAGKTTLLKIAAGFIRPDKGSVWLMGEEITSLGPREIMALRNRLVGFMFQEDLLINSLTISENVELPLIARGFPRRERKRMVSETLERLGIASLARRKPHEVSGGERRRACLAMSIVHRPRILFADEPTSNLDIDTSLTIIEELFNLNKEGTTILMATHDALIAKKIRRVISIRDGSIIGDHRK